VPTKEIQSLGELLTSTTVEVCERLSIPYKTGNINVVQLDQEIKKTVPALAKVMWDYFYAFHRYNFYSSALDNQKTWATMDELQKRGIELDRKKEILYEQLEVMASLNRQSLSEPEFVSEMIIIPDTDHAS
jgi:hypothetical protein